ncbi:MAG: ParB/RepB/Spo0J family partition protein [Actinomycetaceae bacterium]|nr:ParB/RepB/Spo0J family partition protein [Actinomycetaceae bacterium]
MSIKKGLGRGADAILGGVVSLDPTEVPNLAGTPLLLPIDRLTRGSYQPRIHMDEGTLQELAESIREQGIMQPILVRPINARAGDDEYSNAEYEIIAGERRYCAARIAGLDEVPVLVRDVSDETAAAMSLIENMQREDLNPLEEARGIRRLIDEFGMTHEQAAEAVGKNRSTASNLLRLLNLAEPVQDMLMAGNLSEGHARALLALNTDEQISVARKVVGGQLSVRATEDMVRRLRGEEKPQRRNTEKTAYALKVESELKALFDLPVELRLKAPRRNAKDNGQEQKPRGEMLIRFKSQGELEVFLEKLRTMLARNNE